MPESAERSVLVVIGVGGIGLAIAQSLSQGKFVFLADFSQANLDTASETLQAMGRDCQTLKLDISKYDKVAEFATSVGKAGRINAIIHTAGVSPAQASAKAIYEVDLVGTANIIDAFFPLVSAGTSFVGIASMAAHRTTLTPDLERHLATAPREQLLAHEAILLDGPQNDAYSIAKKGNVLRVQAAARLWGSKGARINTISPGIILTPMSKEELAGPNGDYMRQMIEASAARRAGTSDDIANAVAFLTGPLSEFITGTDLLVDGGAIPSEKWNVSS